MPGGAPSAMSAFSCGQRPALGTICGENVKRGLHQRGSYGGFSEPMAIIFLLKGIVIGFSIAAPVGPIGVLCIRRTLSNGWASGLISGLGAATADAIYGSIAGFGLTFISNFLVSQEVMAPPRWRGFPLLPWNKDFSFKGFGADGHCQENRFAGGLCVHVSPDPDKSFDHYFFCRGFCRIGAGNLSRRLPVCRFPCFRRFLWIGLVVVFAERRHWALPCEIFIGRITVGKQILRRNDCFLRFDRSREPSLRSTVSKSPPSSLPENPLSLPSTSSGQTVFPIMAKHQTMNGIRVCYFLQPRPLCIENSP